VGSAQLADAAGESILCHEGWQRGSSQMTLGGLVHIIKCSILLWFSADILSIMCRLSQQQTFSSHIIVLQFITRQSLYFRKISSNKTLTKPIAENLNHIIVATNEV